MSTGADAISVGTAPAVSASQYAMHAGSEPAPNGALYVEGEPLES